MKKNICFYMGFILVVSLTKAANPETGACPATEWKGDSMLFKKSFKKDSVTVIPGVKVLEDADLVSVLTWEEQSLGAGKEEKIHKLRNPALVYGRESIKVDWNGLEMNLLLAFEGHFNDDFMKIDDVKVGDAEYLAAQNQPNAPKSSTVVNGSSVHWVWHKKLAVHPQPTEPVLTLIQKEGSEIELSHNSTRIEIEAVKDSNEMDSFVLGSDGNPLYPGMYDSLVPMKHKITVNCP